MLMLLFSNICHGQFDNVDKFYCHFSVKCVLKVQMGRKSKNKYTFKNKQSNKTGKAAANNVIVSEKAEKQKNSIVLETAPKRSLIENHNELNKNTLRNTKLTNKTNNVKFVNGNTDLGKIEMKECKNVQYVNTPFFHSPAWFRTIVEELAKELKIYPDVYKPF